MEITNSTYGGILTVFKDGSMLTPSHEGGISKDGNLTTLTDTARSWTTNMWANTWLKVLIDGIYYYRLIASNTATVLTFATLPAGTAEVETLTITQGASLAVDVKITLNGVEFTVAVAQDDTAAQVAGKIRAATFTGWTVTGADTTATFTKDAAGVCSAPVFDDNASGVEGGFEITTAGVDPIPATANMEYQIKPKI